MEGSREICDFAVVRMRGLTAEADKQGARNNACFGGICFYSIVAPFCCIYAGNDKESAV